MIRHLMFFTFPLSFLLLIMAYCSWPGFGELFALTEEKIEKTPRYLLGGDIFNLNGHVKLQSQNGEIIVLTPEQKFYYFRTSYKENSSYELKVLESPKDQKCFVQKSKGILLNDVSDAHVSCHFLQKISGKAVGLRGKVIIENKGTGENFNLNFNGSFSLAQGMILGETYHLQIKEKPEAQICEIKNGQGIIQGHVRNIEVSCSEFANHRGLAAE